MSRPGSDFNIVGNTTGEVVFDTIDERGNKMAVLSIASFLHLNSEEALHRTSDEWET